MRKPNAMVLQQFATERNRLLQAIVTGLLGDDRFVAAWLSGRIGRGEADELDDLDLTVVVTNEASATLCIQPWRTAGKTTVDRLALFTRFGEPAIRPRISLAVTRGKVGL